MSRIAPAVVLSLFVLSAAHLGAAKQRVHIEKVRISFLASSSFLRGTWGLNQDSYLAEFVDSNESSAMVVRLIDSYPNEWPPLSREVLTSPTASVLRVTRDASCDSSFAAIPLRAAPGDLSAILSIPLTYSPRLPRKIGPDELIPCYRLVRRGLSTESLRNQ